VELSKLLRLGSALLISPLSACGTRPAMYSLRLDGCASNLAESRVCKLTVPSSSKASVRAYVKATLEGVVVCSAPRLASDFSFLLFAASDFAQAMQSTQSDAGPREAS